MRTYGDLIKAAEACTTKDEARGLVKSEVAAVMEGKTALLEEQARSIVLHNIGYMAGYLNRAAAARLLDLFETRHPYFGAIENWPKTPEEAVEMGFRIGLQAKERGHDEEDKAS
jgi:hypothetical protein